ADRERLGELVDRRLPLGEAGQQGPWGGVGQGGERGAELIVGHLVFNSLVVQPLSGICATRRPVSIPWEKEERAGLSPGRPPRAGRRRAGTAPGPPVWRRRPRTRRRPSRRASPVRARTARARPATRPPRRPPRPRPARAPGPPRPAARCAPRSPR